MEHHRTARRRAWQSLSTEEKQQRLAAVRRRHQELIASEVRRLLR